MSNSTPYLAIGGVCLPSHSPATLYSSIDGSLLEYQYLVYIPESLEKKAGICELKNEVVKSAEIIRVVNTNLPLFGTKILLSFSPLLNLYRIIEANMQAKGAENPITRSTGNPLME